MPNTTEKFHTECGKYERWQSGATVSDAEVEQRYEAMRPKGKPVIRRGQRFGLPADAGQRRM